MADIIPTVVVSMPSQLFTLARSFKAAANGSIYLGKVDTDPLIPANQIQAYVSNEDGTYTEVPQPIKINVAGYPVYEGQIAKFVTVEGQSMTVLDSFGVQQFYFPNVLKYDPDQLKLLLASPSGSDYIGLWTGGNLTDAMYYVTPQMFGAKGNGVDSDQQAFLDAIAFCKLFKYPTIYVPAGDYPVTGFNLNGPSGSGFFAVRVVGDNKKTSKLMFTPASNSSICISLVGGSGDTTSGGVENLRIVPFNSALSWSGTGVEIDGACFASVRNVIVENLNISFSLRNRLANSFTEFNTFTGCRSLNSNVGISFLREAGNESFHGNRFHDFQINVKAGGGVGVKSTGRNSSNVAYLYNCLFDLNIFGGSTCYAFDIYNTNTSGNTGDIQAEGDLICRSDGNSLWTQDGCFYSQGGITYSVTDEIDVKLGRFVWLNRSSRSAEPFVNAPLTGFTPGINYRPIDIASVTAAAYNFRAVGTNMNSQVFTCLAGFDNGFYFGNIGNGQSVQNFNPGFFISAGGGILKSYNTTNGITFYLGETSYLSINTASLRPVTDGGLNAGAGSFRFNEGHFISLYSASALIITSDKRKKKDFRSVDERLVEAVRNITPKQFRMIEGDDKWVIGYIAQDVVTAFSEQGLDAEDYSVVHRDDNGFYALEYEQIAILKSLL